MKTANRVFSFGASLLLMAGTGRAAEPIGPVDDPADLPVHQQPAALRKPNSVDDFKAFQGVVLDKAAADEFLRNFTPVPAAGKPSGAPPTPTTQPVSPKVAALIEQLGDDKFAKRQDAADALKELGAEVLPALRQAATSTNPQIRTSAQALIGEMTGSTTPKPAVGLDRLDRRFRMGRQFVAGGVQGGGVRVFSRTEKNSVVNGQITRDMTAQENDRKIQIHEDADGIKMQITENGQTKETTAKNAADLKANDPAMFKEYEKYSGQAPGVIRIEPGLR